MYLCGQMRPPSRNRGDELCTNPVLILPNLVKIKLIPLNEFVLGIEKFSNWNRVTAE